MSNAIGRCFVVTSFGESHGSCVGVLVDGCPAGLTLNEAVLSQDLQRRRATGQPGATPRSEPDAPRIVSGVLNDTTTGAPICMMVDNLNVKSEAYESLADTPRPGHADYPAGVKYGRFNDPRGGGRFSGRITAGFVMAGSVAKAALATVGIEIFAHTVSIENVMAASVVVADARQAWKKNPLSCADPEAAAEMARAIASAASDGDSVGGVVECLALNVPVGLGEPVFDSVESVVSHALYSIPAVKGVEFGAGFGLASMRGTASNDAYAMENDAVRTTKNDAGGVLGGISSGMPIVARAAIKPTPSVSMSQKTVNLATGTDTSLFIEGRHDACIVPRAVVVVEAMMAISLCDLAIRAGVLRKVIE